MALTKIGTDGVKDDAITSGKIPANAVGSSELADQSVSLDKLPHGTSSTDGKFLRANNGADPTFETVNTDLVADTSPQLGGQLQSNGQHINLEDSDKLKLGTNGDTELYHNNTDAYIQNHTGDLYIENVGSNSDDITIKAKDNVSIRVQTNESAIECFGDGSVDLYYDGTKRVFTSPGGLQINAAGSNPIITNTSSPVYANAGLELHRGGNGYCNARFASNYGTTLSLAGISNTNTTEFSFIQDNGGNAYVRNEHTNPIRFQIGSSGLSSSNTMVMNNGGEVQVPRQPFFWAYNSSDYSWNNNTVSFETEANDVGGNYNNSTYTFTCPIAGVYMFVVYMRTGGSFSEFSWTLQKNGGNFIRIIGQGSFAGNDCSFGQTIQACSVNDTWRVHGSGSHGGATGGYPYNGFQGYLLG